MPRKESKDVPESNSLVSQQEQLGSGEPTLADVYRLFEEMFDKQQKRIDSFFDGMNSCFDRWNGKLDEISDETRVMDQHVTSLEHGARQPRLAMEADGPANVKTRERTEGAVIAVQAMHGDSCTTALKVQDGPKTSISFGVMAEPPDLPRREDVLVEDGATSPESCLPSLEMRSSTAAGGLVPTGETSTATETTVNKPLLQSYSSEEKNSKKKQLRTSTPYVSYDSSAFQDSN